MKKSRENNNLLSNQAIIQFSVQIEDIIKITKSQNRTTTRTELEEH